MNIENITLKQAIEIAEETKIIKDHTVIFADLKKHMDSRLGYSALVFKNGRHIHYANVYELNWEYFVREHGRESLNRHFTEILNDQLYTDEELMSGIKDYMEYQLKNYFLRNYWIMRYDYISIYDKEEMKNKGKATVYDPISFCYVCDVSIVEDQTKLLKNIESEYKKLTENDNAFRHMVRSELYNHEACVTGEYTEALASLGFKYENLTDSRKKIVDEELHKQIYKYDC